MSVAVVEREEALFLARGRVARQQVHLDLD
jgi:hypothetical protein